MQGGLASAIVGAVIGETLGAPHTGSKSSRSLSFFEPVPSRMSACPALDAWLVCAAFLKHGGPIVGLDSFYGQHWDNYAAEVAFGRRNMFRGLGAPLSGSFDNPLSHGSEAIGRAIFWGLAYLGDPDKAGACAKWDASIDHAGEGVVAAVAVARMMASVSPSANLNTLLAAVSGHLPSGSRCRAAFEYVLQSVGQPDPLRAVQSGIMKKTGAEDFEDASVTFGSVLAGLVIGKGDFGRSVCAAAGCAGASSHAGLATGAIVGLMSGPVDQEWAGPLGDVYVAGGWLKGIDPPATIAEFVETVLAEKAEVVLPPAVFDTGDRHMLKQASGVWVKVEYLDGPVTFGESSLKLAITLWSETGCDVEAAIAATGWRVGTRLGSVRLEPQAASVHAAVFSHPGLDTDTFFALTINGDTVQFPLLACDIWYKVGPFANHDGSGFDKVYPAEKNLSTGEVFSGRSELPTSWSRWPVAGSSIDIESEFGNGAGAVYLYGRFDLSPGDYQIVAAGSPGVVLTIDGQSLVRYNDTHIPVPRAKNPYTAKFVSKGDIEVMIKLTRDRPPAGLLTLYLLDESGRVLRFGQAKPMDP